MCKQHALRIAWTIAGSIAFLDFRVLRWKFTYNWKCVNATYRVPLFMPTACFPEGPSPPFTFCSFWRRRQRLEAVGVQWLSQWVLDSRSRGWGFELFRGHYVVSFSKTPSSLLIDWLQPLKQFFINVSYHILVANITLMAVFFLYDMTHWWKIVLRTGVSLPCLVLVQPRKTCPNITEKVWLGCKEINKFKQNMEISWMVTE